MRITLVSRSTTLSTTEERTERDFDITAPTILMITSNFNEKEKELIKKIKKRIEQTMLAINVTMINILIVR
jgi:hypothetical protein